MRIIFFFTLVLAGAGACGAQTVGPVILSASNVNPFPTPIAPGQLLTLMVQPGAGNTPVTPSSVSAIYSSYTDVPMPVIQVVPLSAACPSNSTCVPPLAVTVQVPFGIQLYCGVCSIPPPVAETVTISINGASTPPLNVLPLEDQVHFLTACDLIVAGVNASAPLAGGLPCTPLVTHADGTAVSMILAATAGEELVAYATGLGEVSPAVTAGQPVAQSSPTVTSFGIDFNFRANALATMPGVAGVPSAAPLFTGATKGFVGLYQINFIVPQPPPGLVPCVNNASLPPYGNAVVSNLTVSVGSNFSFDGAGICVRPEPVLDPPSP